MCGLVSCSGVWADVVGVALCAGTCYVLVCGRMLCSCAWAGSALGCGLVLYSSLWAGVVLWCADGCCALVYGMVLYSVV